MARNPPQIAPKPDSAIIAAVLAGDAEAFSRLVRAHQARVRGVGARLEAWAVHWHAQPQLRLLCCPADQRLLRGCHVRLSLHRGRPLAYHRHLGGAGGRAGRDGQRDHGVLGGTEPPSTELVSSVHILAHASSLPVIDPCLAGRTGTELHPRAVGVCAATHRQHQRGRAHPPRGQLRRQSPPVHKQKDCRGKIRLMQ